MNRKHLRKLISVYNENSQQGGIVNVPQHDKSLYITGQRLTLPAVFSSVS